MGGPGNLQDAVKPVDAAQASPPANRARSTVTLDVAAAAGVTRIKSLRESGSLRIRFPRPAGEGLLAVLVNTAGGIAEGDRIDVAIDAGEGAFITATTTAAEKIYRSNGADADVSTALRLDSRARLEWLPQETILFDGARLSRRVTVEMADDASLVLCEALMFGRAAMGERMTRGYVVDHWRVRRNGRLVFADSVRLQDDLGSLLGRGAVAAGGGAIATVLIAPGDEDLAARLRAGASSFSGEVGISAWNGIALARFCAPDMSMVRSDLERVLALAGTALPRIWTH